MVYAGIGQYYGHWDKGIRTGEGVMIYVNKDIYSGQWKNGKKDGEGSYIFDSTGMKYIGTFKEGKMIEGKWFYPNGSYFEGKFDNNMPKGPGRWNFANGIAVDGVYTQIQKADIDNMDIKLAWKTLSDITQKLN